MIATRERQALERVSAALSPRNRLDARKATRLATAVPFTPPPNSFNPIYIPHLENYARTQIFYGGAGSGKSVFLAQRDVLDILKGGRNFLICRAVANTIRKSVFAEIRKVINEWDLNVRFATNKSEMTITCDNGYQFLFAGLDDTEKLKSITPERGVITDVRIEEATETDQDSIRQLYRRQRGGDETIPKRLAMSFNPIMRTHHLYGRYFAPIGWADDQTEYDGPSLSILKTWYIHNRFLTPSDIDDLINEADDYYLQVYAYGNWGVLGDVIFTNWEVRDLSDMASQFTNRRNGLDFGFASDPAAFCQSHYDKTRKNIYIFKEIYERGLTNNLLADEIRPFVERELVTCDSAEPKSIQELRDAGINAFGAKKGADSVNHGIQWLQQQRIVIDKRCINSINEFQQYQWKKDKDGNSIRQPVDKNNHIIDGLRYSYEDDMIVRIPQRRAQSHSMTHIG